MTRLKTLRSAALMGAAIWMASIGAADAAGLRASVNTDAVALGDAFQLTLRADATASQPPDLSPLNDQFDILGTSRSSQTRVINGARSDSLSWIVTLAPKELGSVEIPPIAAGSATSDPIDITVVDAASLPGGQTSASGLSVTLDVPEGSHYVHQEIPVTVRIEATAALQKAALAVPDMPDVILTQTGEDRVSQVTRNGVPVSVIERDYLLRPQTSGSITLPPFTLQGQLPDPNSSRRDLFMKSPFDDMFGGPIFGGSMLSDMLNPGRPVVVRSEPVTLEIKASPVTGRDGWFLPAKSVLLQSDWKPEAPSFEVGEAVERHIRIMALGAAPEQLPDITLSEVDGARIYAEHSDARSIDTPEGTAAVRETVVSVVPTRSGEITLPEIRVDWWDTGADQAQTATIPSETIAVPTGAPGAETMAAAPSAAERSTNQAAAPVAVAAESSPMLLAILGFLAAGILAVGGIAAYRMRRTKADPPGILAEPSLATPWILGRKAVTPAPQSASFKRMREACATGDAKAIFAALSVWRLQAGLSSPAVLTANCPELAGHIAELECCLFGTNAADTFNAKLLLKYAEKANRQQTGSRKKAVSGPILPTLYPQSLRPAG